MLSSLLSVDEDFCLLIDSLKMELHNPSLGSAELFPILTLASFIPATTCTSGTLTRIGLGINIPIVREVYTDRFTIMSEGPTIVK